MAEPTEMNTTESDTAARESSTGLTSTKPRSASRPTFVEAARVVALQLAKRTGNRPSNLQRIIDGYSTGLKHRGPSLIIPRLYLGDLFDAEDKDIIESHGITHILSVIEYEPTLIPSHVGETKIEKLHVPLRDTRWSNIRSHFEKTTKWIGDALEDPSSAVLMHCQMGISRSATIVAAYLLSVTSDFDSATEVLDFLRVKRSVVGPNSGFEVQLERHAASCLQLRKSPGGVVVSETKVEENNANVQVDTVEIGTIN